MLVQRTLRRAVSATGVGMHTGDRVKLVLNPAAPNSGIAFRRSDLPGTPVIPALAIHVRDTRLSTCLVMDGVRVGTIEHLMSALAGAGIDNVLVDVSAAEVPILDGSAAPFSFLVRTAGIDLQRAPRKYLRVLKTIEVTQADKRALLEPHDGFKVDFTIEFDHPVFSGDDNHVEIDFGTTSYAREIARARTFGFVSEVEAMHKAGLGRGGSLDNAIVIDDFRVLNAEGLRYRDEFVRHKALDAIGDLYLAGAPLIGAYHGYKSSHELNNRLMRALLADPAAWRIETFQREDEIPPGLRKLTEPEAVETHA